MIIFDRVSKVYGKDIVALDDISIHIQPKEFAIIVGSSGAGKSTFLKLLTREEKQSSGKIIVGGLDYDNLKNRNIPLLRRNIGVVFQDFKLLPNKTVFENVAFALEVSGVASRHIKNVVPKVLELVGVEDKEHMFPRQLSGGEEQRVAIARSIVRQPKILIADEPTGNLDPDNAWEVIEVLKKINDYGTTVLLTTHNREIVDKLKRRVITIRGGQIIADQAKGKYKE